MQKNRRKLHGYMIRIDHMGSTEGKCRPPFLPIIVFGICFQLHQLQSNQRNLSTVAS